MNYNAWTTFYISIVEKLLAYKDNRQALFDKIRRFAEKEPLLSYLHFEDAEFWKKRDNQIDPFTIMGTFNRGISAEHRTMLGQKLAGLLGAETDAPENFHGIAHLDPRNSIFSGNDELWALFMAICSKKLNREFFTAYDHALSAHGNGQAMLTIGMFWCQPFTYMALDGLSLPYIKTRLGLIPPATRMNGQAYAAFLDDLAHAMSKQNISGFPELAYLSWSSVHSD